LDLLVARGLNVYDIVRARRVILTTDALQYVGERFGVKIDVPALPAPPAGTQADESDVQSASG